MPVAKISRVGDAQSGPGRRPVGAHTIASTMPAGRRNGCIERESEAAIIASRQIGPAPSTPARPSIGAPSAFPTHTPIAMLGVKPMVQVSRNPVLVPVFTAAGKGTSNGVTPPNPGMRASGSLKMSATRYTCSGLRTRRVAGGACA